MPEDLAVLQFLEVFPVFFRWEEFFDDSWGLPSAAAILLGAVLQFRLLKSGKRTPSIWLPLTVVLAAIFCEYGYQATPGFDAFIFALAEIVLLFSLVGMALGALAYLIWTRIRPS